MCTGKEEARARDLFYGLWINDLFMRRVEGNDDWSLFCPNEAPGLAEVWGEEFDELYTRCASMHFILARALGEHGSKVLYAPLPRPVNALSSP